MLNMIEWWVCLSMPPDEVEKIARFRALNPAQKALMLSARKESGKYSEGKVLSKSMEALFRAVPPNLALALAMTEPEEKAERARLMREHGCTTYNQATPGTLLVDDEFKFSDGKEAKKILVCLGTNAGLTVIAKTTSNGKRYTSSFGCQSHNRFPCFHIPKGASILRKPTWVCLDKLHELDKEYLLLRHFSGTVKAIGTLENELLKQLLECILTCEDITPTQKYIVNTARKNLHT